MLRSEQIYSVIAVGLIEAYDVGAGRKAAIFKLNRRLRDGDLDVLADESPHHLGHARAVALIGGNKERIRRLAQTFLPGIPALLIEILQHVRGVIGAVVQSGEGGSLLIIKV